MMTTMCGALRTATCTAGLALATMLVACGGGGSNDDAIAYDNHLPLHEGDRRVYRERGTSKSLGTELSISTEGVIRTFHVDGTLYHLVGSSGGQQTVLSSLYEASSTGIRVRSFWNQQQPPLDLVRFPTSAGVNFVQDLSSDQDRSLDGTDYRYRVRVTTSVVGLETLTTPAGEFSNALHVREQTVSIVWTSRANSESTYTRTQDTWYVPNVGRVRWEVRNDDSEVVGELMRHVPAGRPEPDSTPPILVRAGPPSGTSLHAGAPLVLTFNEPVTSASLAAVTVTNSQGMPVHVTRVGPFDPEGRTVNLSAPSGWGEGIHTIHVTKGIEDLAGNVMAALPDSTFAVSNEFALVDAHARRFAVDVEHEGPLSARMNMPIDLSTLTAVRLRENDSVVPATVSSVYPERLEITPAVPLKPSTRYTVDLGGLKSDTGQPLANPQDWTFTTSARQKTSGIAVTSQWSRVR
jgi:hypothetical protein